MAAKLDAEGWIRGGTDPYGMRCVSYDYADTNRNFHGDTTTTIEHHGGHNRYGSSGHQGDGHNNDAYIQHPGYHLAWYIWDHHTNNNSLDATRRMVDKVVHSMGGLTATYALMKLDQDTAGFPQYL